MQIEKLDAQFSVSAQITASDIAELQRQGVEVLVCNRPDDEESGQPKSVELEALAKQSGIAFFNIPFTAETMTTAQRDQLQSVLATGQRVHAYCRSGARSKKLWTAAQANTSKDRTFDGVKYDVVIVGAGSAGIATAASLRKRNKRLRIALIDPSAEHFYQPGWTMVGGGVFTAKTTQRQTADLIPRGCDWIQNTVVGIQGANSCVQLLDGCSVYYQHLVVAPGLKLDWAGVEGLAETLGHNGVTSNYRYDLAPYTWQLVQNLQRGTAIFTQPAMPIKCAGAPQKAMYLSASEWLRKGKLKDIDVRFYNSGGVLFGVAAYVPALMQYVEKYSAQLCFSQTLIKVDGAAQTAWFKDADGNVSETHFDLLHVCPPQVAPDFIRASELSDAAGWLDVNPATLQSSHYANIWGVGDVLNTTNAKTMAAARKQAPVVAQNITNCFSEQGTTVHYDGYGSCPLTVEHGKIVLAEFTYGGVVAPSFPKWLNDGTHATRLAWFLKARVLPSVYWHGMLKGREWLAGPAA